MSHSSTIRRWLYKRLLWMKVRSNLTITHKVSFTLMNNEKVEEPSKLRQNLPERKKQNKLYTSSIYPLDEEISQRHSWGELVLKKTIVTALGGKRSYHSPSCKYYTLRLYLIFYLMQVSKDPWSPPLLLCEDFISRINYYHCQLYSWPNSNSLWFQYTSRRSFQEAHLLPSWQSYSPL